MVHRVLGHIVYVHLKVEVAAGGIAGTADEGDLLALRYRFADLDLSFAAMGIEGADAVAMVDDDAVAVGKMPLGGGHDAVGGGEDREFDY